MRDVSAAGLRFVELFLSFIPDARFRSHSRLRLHFSSRHPLVFIFIPRRWNFAREQSTEESALAQVLMKRQFLFLSVCQRR